MKTSKWLRFRIGIVLSVFLAVFFIVPQAQSKEKYVTWFSNADYTGPIAVLCIQQDMGTEDYFKYINEQGGVNGVQIKFIGVDTRYDAARMVSVYKRYHKTPKLLATTTYSTGVTKILSAYLEKDKLVQFTPADGEFQAHRGRTFLWGPCYQDGFAAIIDWIVKDWKSKGKSGMPKIGRITWDNPYGKEELRGGKEYAEKLGVDLLPSEYFPPGTLKHDVYLKRLADAGAHYIHIGGVDPTPTNIIRDAHQLGLTEKIQFSSGFWGLLIHNVKAHPIPQEGVVIVSPYLRGEEALNNPLVKEVWTKYRGSMDTFVSEGYLMGISLAINFCNALKLALDEVGFDRITGDDMYRALQKVSGKDVRGLMGPCTWGPNSRRSSEAVKIYQVKKGKVVPITEWVKAPDAVSFHKW